MQSNAANQNEEVTRIIRFAPATSRPHSPAQTPWQGELPRGVKEIITRSALNPFGERYVRWASNFALLTDEFIAQVLKAAPDMTKQPYHRQWDGFKWAECYSCRVGDNYLWVQKHGAGCTVELCFPDNADPDARVLTMENMPVLCPDPTSAALLAEACYPNPPANLVWHSYW